jgi:hypothetical protein
MIAALDAIVPPLDPALGAFLLLACGIGYGLARLLDRARREPPRDPHAREYGDVTEVPPNG